MVLHSRSIWNFIFHSYEKKKIQRRWRKKNNRRKNRTLKELTAIECVVLKITSTTTAASSNDQINKIWWSFESKTIAIKHCWHGGVNKIFDWNKKYAGNVCRTRYHISFRENVASCFFFCSMKAVIKDHQIWSMKQ